MKKLLQIAAITTFISTSIPIFAQGSSNTDSATNTSTSQFAIPAPRETQVVSGGGNVQIAVQEWGNPNGKPIVFVHALINSHLGYLPQVTGPLAKDYRLITFDNRGHGNSGKPSDMAAYQEGEYLADDLAAVIALTGNEKPIVVAWSIGGVVMDDYLAKYGDNGISGVVYLGAGHTLGEHANPYIGVGFAQHAMGMLSHDLATRTQATIAVSRANTAHPLPPEMFAFGLATSMVVPSEARTGLISRSVNHIENTLPNVSVPAFFLHGSADQIVQTRSSKDAAKAVKNGVYIEVPGIGHTPSFEAPAEVEKVIRRAIAAAK